MLPKQWNEKYTKLKSMHITLLQKKIKLIKLIKLNPKWRDSNEWMNVLMLRNAIWVFVHAYYFNLSQVKRAYSTLSGS